LRTAGSRNKISLLIIAFLSLPVIIFAQQGNDRLPGEPVTLSNAPQRDTSNKTNTNQWKDEQAVTTYKKSYSLQVFSADTTLHIFHRRLFTRDWNRDIGNSGSAVFNLLFTPEFRVGPTLGYHVFDVYRFNPDSLNYYNTTRPYSSFIYQLGSKAEQLAEFIHTQNINPNWNFAVQYRKISAPGHYKIQRTNHDCSNLTTHYHSKSQHYNLYGAFVYNKLQNDENGGIIADSFLKNESFGDRKTIPVWFQDDAYSTKRSAVTNMLRDYSISLLHHYTIGNADTLYNADSTRYTYTLTPRFRISHQFRFGSEKHQFKDVRPDSLRYDYYFPHEFSSGDSLFSEQKWIYIDNAVTVSGFVGYREKQLGFSVGAGNRFDRFRTEYVTGNDKEDIISNYLTGEIKKEALREKEWSVNTSAKLFITGKAAGSFLFHAEVGKEINKTFGKVLAGFDQRLQDAPYSYTFYHNQYFEQLRSFDKESLTQIFASFENERLNISAGIRNYIISNFIYISPAETFEQSSDPFNILQVWGKKAFHFGNWVFDNQLVLQQNAGDAPVNIPSFMGRHQFSYERFLFANTLQVATGVDVRWHSAYNPAAYSPLYNRFFYQDSYLVGNPPETSIFFNFKIKNFRAYLMGDRMEKLFSKNIINAPGYPSQDAMIKFGFNWVMIN
jgi:hypothetical protein